MNETYKTNTMPVSLSKEQPQSFTEVHRAYSQQADADTELLRHMDRLAAAEAQAEQALVTDIETKETELPAHNITPEHHQDHIERLSAVVPEAADWSAGKVDLAAETLELGDTAIEDAADDLAEGIVTKPGSMPATWKERSIASETVESGFEDDWGVTGNNIGEIGHQKGYQVDKVPVALGVAGSEGTIYKPVSELSDDERELFGVTPEGAVSNFDDLEAHTKQALFTARLQETEALSQDVRARAAATRKNIEWAQAGTLVRPGDYVHGLSTEDLPSILNKGLIAGEGLGAKAGESAKFDRFPYNLDAYDAEMIGALDGDKVDIANAGTYGDVVAVIDRGAESTDHGNEPDSARDNGHRLIFGGVPATEIRGLHVRSEYGYGEAEAINAVVGEGFYIPIYDSKGSLILTYDDFKNRHEAGHREMTIHEKVEAETLAQQPEVKVSEDVHWQF